GCHGGPVYPGPGPGQKVEPKKMPVEKKAQGFAPATIVVTLPADAKLIIDGNVTKSTSERRTFVSPDLEPDAAYVHELTAEILVDGRTVTQTQRVTVRAGAVAEVPFNFASQNVASR